MNVNAILARFVERLPFAHPYFHLPRIGRMSTGGVYLPSEVARAYGFPSKQKRVIPYKPVITIMELGGGYYPGDNQASFTSQHLPLPNMTNYSVQGAGNNPGDAADGEVAVDIQMAAGAYSSIIDEAAEVGMVWAPNSDTGMPGSVKMARSIPHAVNQSQSWGQMEKGWSPQSRQSYDTEAQTSVAAGITIFGASGDNNSGDGGTGKNVDYPAACPWVVGCGATALMLGPDGSPIEKVWNDGQSGTGGGLSVYYDLPPWQRPAQQGQTKRGVPDVSLVGDPATGIVTWVNGQRQVIGGTSVVAPFLAGVHAAMVALGLDPKIPFLQYLYGLPLECFHDITAGNNGAYQATPGQDLCTGIGTLDGRVLFANLGGTPQPPVPPVPVPPVPVPPVPQPPADGPTAAQCVTLVNRITDWYAGHFRRPYSDIVTGVERFHTAGLEKLFTSPPSPNDTHTPFGTLDFEGEPMLVAASQTIAKDIIKKARAELAKPNIDWVTVASLVYQLLQVIFGALNPTPPVVPAAFAAAATAGLAPHTKALDAHLAALDSAVSSNALNWGNILKIIGVIIQILGPVLGGLGGVPVAP